MNFEEWWTENYADAPTGSADRTFGEEVWNAAQKETWRQVFQIVSDRPDLASRAFIMKLEEARGLAGAGP